MAVPIFQIGQWSILEFCKALGIDPTTQFVKKIVIEAGVDQITQVYVARHLERDQQDKLCAVLAQGHQDGAVAVREVADVQVSEKGEVEVAR